LQAEEVQAGNAYCKKWNYNMWSVLVCHLSIVNQYGDMGNCIVRFKNIYVAGDSTEPYVYWAEYLVINLTYFPLFAVAFFVHDATSWTTIIFLQ